jgi:hypothetical protein
MDSRPLPLDRPDEVPRFDVFVRLPRGLTPEEVERRAVEQAGMSTEHATRIAEALRVVPYVQVRRSVDEGRARKTAYQLTTVGLKVEVKRLPGHALAAVPAPAAATPAKVPVAVAPEDMEFDLHGSDEPGVPPPSPAPAAQQAAEYSAAYHAAYQSSYLGGDTQIESGRDSEPAGRPSQPATRGPTDAPPVRTRRRRGPRWGLLMLILVLVALLAFALGRLSWPWGSVVDSPAAAAMSIDTVLSALGAPPAPEPVAPSGAARASHASAAAENLGAESLVQIARAERAKGRAATLDQAVAQAQGVTGSAGLLLPGDQLPPGLAAQAEEPTAAGPGSGGKLSVAGAVPPLPVTLRSRLTADLAVQLAEFGQAARAREVLARVQADAAVAREPLLADSAQRADTLLRAWAVRDAAPDEVDRAVTVLRGTAHAIESPAMRAALLGRVATVLARHDNVPDALALACLADAGETLKAIPDATTRQNAIEDWLVDTGDLLVSQLARHARLGRWAQAQSLVGQLDALANQARGRHALLQLQALRARAQTLIGRPAKADELLTGVLKSWNRMGALARQAEELRALAVRTDGMGAPELFQAAVQLATAAESQRGSERDRTLTTLALMQADAGDMERFDAMRAMLRQNPAAASAESSMLTAQLLVGGELAAARADQRAGAFGQAEARVRKVAAYLL